MSWRSIIIANPAHLSYKYNALQIQQGDNPSIAVPLEDIAQLLLF